MKFKDSILNILGVGERKEGSNVVRPEKKKKKRKEVVGSVRYSRKVQGSEKLDLKKKVKTVLKPEYM